MQLEHSYCAPALTVLCWKQLFDILMTLNFEPPVKLEYGRRLEMWNFAAVQNWISISFYFQRIMCITFVTNFIHRDRWKCSGYFVTKNIPLRGRHTGPCRMLRWIIRRPLNLREGRGNWFPHPKWDFIICNNAIIQTVTTKEKSFQTETPKPRTQNKNGATENSSCVHHPFCHFNIVACINKIGKSIHNIAFSIAHVQFLKG